MEEKEEHKDLGLGQGHSKDQKRSVNKDGSFNVKKIGAVSGVRDLYKHLIYINWWRFLLGVFSVYIAINLVFACTYYLIGPEYLTGLKGESPFNQFLDCFFFSTQTFATVGYGAISPKGNFANAVASFESLVGLLSFALATGLLFGRFSKPNAKILFSEKILLSPYRKDKKGLMFRIVNKRKNTLLDASVEVIIAFDFIDEQGNEKRSFKSLNLEISDIKLFTTSWTIVHPVDKDSPLYGLTEEQYLNMKFEVLVLIKAFDETYGQFIYARTSFTEDEFVYQAKFDPATRVNSKGYTEINLDTVNNYKLTNSFDV